MTKLRRFRYDEPDSYGNDVTVTVDEDYIKRTYWLWWRKRIENKFYRNVILAHNLTFENCIRDWCTTHYAQEIK